MRALARSGAICFDLDDTLYPYEAYARAGLRSAADHLAERTGRRLHEELFELYFREGITEETFDRLLDRHDLPSELVGALVEAFHDQEGPLLPHPGTERAISRLGTRADLGVVTGGRNGREKLRRLGLYEHFDAVVVAPDLKATKRERAPFERALEALDATPDRAIYVGDDPRVDFQVPNRMGMTTVRVRRGRYVDLEPSEELAAPDHEVDRLGNLLPRRRP